MYVVVDVYCMGSDNLDCSWDDRRVVMLFSVHFFLTLLGLHSRFESLGATLSLCHWEG